MQRFILFILLTFSFLVSSEIESFKKAKKTVHQTTSTPAEVIFQKDKAPALNEFFKLYKKNFNLSENFNFKLVKSEEDFLKTKHHRFKQYYKEIEIADIQYILHEQDGRVYKANGKIIHSLDVDTEPGITKEKALANALKDIKSKRYSWQEQDKEAQKLSGFDPKVFTKPQGKLILTSGRKKQLSENFKLAWRFDIFSFEPFQRFWVDVDAQNGTILNKIDQFPTGDVPLSGETLYNGTVDITGSDEDFPELSPAFWHPSQWNAYGNNGDSWWCADESLGNNGGYGNYWYKTLDTEPFFISGENAKLTFYHRYSFETPGGEPTGYNGWDGANIRISTDGGLTWTILSDPTPAYGKSSLYSFGLSHGEGTGVPGWVGELKDWIMVEVDLSAYQDQQVQVRFAFASDPAYSTADGGDPDLFGWQLDEILVSSSSGTLFYNSGENSQMIALNKEVIVEGNYRLRQRARSGVFTLDLLNDENFSLAEDIVDEDGYFDVSRAKTGISAHWAAENTYDYFLTTHNRDSYDDKGSPVISYVHALNGWFNAQWLGDRMRFGDGTNNQTPLTSLDVVAHEFTHGVTQETAGLIYQDEYGALNESFSDIFGAAVEYYIEGEQGDWLIAEDFGAFRNMESPAQYGDPDTYRGTGWITDPNFDNGGVHINSGVQNKWFQLLTDGGSGVNDFGFEYNVGGIGLEEAAQIAYRNLSVYLFPTAEYFDARLGAINSAVDLFGKNSEQMEAVIDAWDAVGVYKPSIDPTLVYGSDSLNFYAEVETGVFYNSVDVINFGIDTLIISGLSTKTENFKVDENIIFPVELAYDDTLSINISFSAETEGTYHDSLYIESNDTLSKALPLSGKGYFIYAAEQGKIYGVSDQTDGNVLLNLSADDTATVVGKSGFNKLYSLALNPVTKEIISTDLQPEVTNLVRLNSREGDAYTYSSVPLKQLIAIAFKSDSDTLYGIEYATGIMYKVIPQTGDTIRVGETNVNRIFGLSFNPLNEKLYGVNIRNDLYRFNLKTAEATRIGNTGISQMRDIAFDETGKLFGLAGTSASIITDFVQIDTATAAATVVTSTGFNRVTALLITGPVVTDIQRLPEVLPDKFTLEQNYPNPFNPKTVFKYSIPVNSEISLTVFNALGQEVSRILSNEDQSAGTYRIEWNALTNEGRKLSTGMYIYQLKVKTASGKIKTFTKKMLLIK